MTIQEQSASGTSLPLLEAFYTIQGEGKIHWTIPAYFIPIRGLIVGCGLVCMLKKAGGLENGAVLSVTKKVEWGLYLIQERHNWLLENHRRWGQHLTLVNFSHWPAQASCEAKVGDYHYQNIETSGVPPIPFLEILIGFVFPPKKFKKHIYRSYKEADELKVVVFPMKRFCVCWGSTQSW